MGRIKWKKIILLVLLLLLCLPLGGTHSLAAEEEKGFVIHADKVVGILDLGGIILDSPKVIVGKLPIAFIQADISGLSMERVIDTPQGTMVLSIRSGGKASATLMKLDVTKLTFGGLCFDGFPIKQCLKDVTLVATKTDSVAPFHSGYVFIHIVRWRRHSASGTTTKRTRTNRCRERSGAAYLAARRTAARRRQRGANGENAASGCSGAR